jgi:hypothetical protein
MPLSVQQFLADSTRKASADLVTALLRVPEDKRDWSPMGDARTALDQVAECALMNDSTVGMLKSHQFPDFNMDDYAKARAALIADWPALESLLKESTEKVAAALLEVPDADFDIEIPMPWGPITVLGVMAYPHWNMTYHEAQINYVASLLGALK